LLQSIAIWIILLAVSYIYIISRKSEDGFAIPPDSAEVFAFVIAYLLPITAALTLIIHVILQLFRLLKDIRKIAVILGIAYVIAHVVWSGFSALVFQLIRFEEDDGDSFIYYNWYKIGVLCSAIVAFIYVRTRYEDLFEYDDVIIGGEQETPVDSVYKIGSKEFNKAVANNELTVMPTGDRPPVGDPSHGTAHFVPDSVKEELTEKNPQRGLWLGGGFFHHREGNLLTVAAPGSGKGAALIIPNLLISRDYKHSFVVFDPKGTNAAITARFQQESGQKIIILDPANLQGLNNATHGVKAASFNPLDFISDNIVRGCSQIANLLLPDDPKADDKIWRSEARDLIQSLLMHIMTHPKYEGQRNLVTLYRLFRQKSWDDILLEMAENLACDEKIFDAAKKMVELKETSEKTFGSVVFSTGEAINWLKDPDLQTALLDSSFNPADIDKGGITLYLCIPIDSIEIYSTWGRLIVGGLLYANSRPSGRSKAWCYYLLDEFPTMGVFPEVIKALAFSREFKMRIWLYAQNLAQLDRIYTENQRKEILGTCGVFQAFAVNEPTTANYVSERLGVKTVSKMVTSRSESFGGESNTTSYSTSKNDFQRALLFSNEVEREKNMICFSEIGTYRLVKWMYWKSPTNNLEAKYFKVMNANADKNINYS